MYRVWNGSRTVKKVVKAEGFQDLKTKGRLDLELSEVSCVVLNSDGTEIEDDDTLKAFADQVFLLLSPNETWTTPTDDNQQLTSQPLNPTHVTVIGNTGGIVEHVNVVAQQTVHKQTVRHVHVKAQNVHEQHIHAVSTGILGEQILDAKIEAAQKFFVETHSYNKIEAKLMEYGHITLCGASGEGKTATSLMLALGYREKGYKVVFVEDIEVFNLDTSIDSTSKLFLIIDDIFGSNGISADISKMRQLLDNIDTHVERCREASKNPEQSAMLDKRVTDEENLKPTSQKDIVVVFSSKTFNFKAGLSQLRYQRMRLFREDTVVDLTEDGYYHYSQLEMEAIFERHRDRRGGQFTGDIEEVLNDKSDLFGFPMTCKLFFCLSFKDELVSAADFFKRPLHYLRIELNSLLRRNDNKSAVLILMFLCEDKLDLAKLQTPSDDLGFEKIIEIVPQFEESIERSRTRMYFEAKNLKGTFFVGGDTLSFAHSSIYDSCAFEIFELNPNFVLQHSSDNFFYDFLKPEIVDSARVDDRLHDVSVSENYIEKIAKRLASVIKQGRFAKSVTHPMLEHDQVFKKLIEKLRIRDEDTLNMGAKSSSEPTWIHKKHNGRCFLYWAILGHRPEIVQNIEQEMNCTFTQSEISEGVDGCTEKDNLTILKCLCSRIHRSVFDSRKTYLLLSAVKNGSSDIAIYLLEEKADPSSVDEEMHNILHIACKTGQFDLMNKVMKSSLIPSRTFKGLLNDQDLGFKTPVMFAASIGSEDFFHLFKPLSDLTKTDQIGNDTLHLACMGGNKLIVQELLSQSNINKKNWCDYTPVMIAASTGQKDVFDLLVSRNADLTLMDDRGTTLLYMACMGGNTHIIQELLSTTNINSGGKYGHTPVMIAAIKGHKDLFNLLTSKKADLALVDDFGDTLLHQACQGGNKFIVQHLLTSVEINAKGLYGRTPIMIAALFGQQKAFELLVSKGADLTIQDDLGNTLLNLGCRGGDKLIVEKYLLSSANTNIRGEAGRTPVMNAANEGRQNIFQLLVSKKADLTVRDDGRNTLLHVACRGGNKIIVERLLKSININNRGRNGWTPVMVATMAGHNDVFELLLSKNADVSLVDDTNAALVHLACKGGNCELLERLLTPSNINRKGENGWTPVMIAAFRGHKSVFWLLVSQKADLTLVDDHGDSVLHLACRGGTRLIVQYLLQFLDKNSRGYFGSTPIMMAAEGGWQDVFKLLISNKADITLEDDLGNELLHHACKGGNKFIVQQLLSSSSINNRGEFGKTPIMMAAENKEKDVFELLLSKKADLTVVDKFSNGLIHLVCKGGNKWFLEKLLSPSNINIKGGCGRTPVMMAAMTGQRSTFDVLVSEKADLTLVDENGNALIHLACQGGNTAIVQKLLSTSNLNIRGECDRTPVMMAAMTGQKSIFHILESEKADLTLMDENGNALVHMACQGGNTAIVQKLLSTSNRNIRGECGRTPVMLAAMTGQKDLFEFLVSKDVDLTLTDDYGNTLLHLACKGGSKFIVQYVLSASNINIKGEHGRTPVMMAAIKAERDVFELLVSQKADLTVVDDCGDTLVHLACQGGNKYIVQYLLTSPSNINIRGQYGRTPVMRAAITGVKDVFDLLVSKKADLRLQNHYGDTVLHHACQGGNKHIVQYLLTSSNINHLGQNNVTPVMLAAYKGNMCVFKFLVSKKADLTLIDDIGNSLLHHACKGGNILIVQKLLTTSNINSRGEHGHTPIMMAATAGQKDLFELLVSKKADLKLKDVKGNSLLTLACHGGNKYIAEYLLPLFDINIRGYCGWTPVMAAANEGQQKTFSLLVSKNADLKLVDDQRNTILHLACQGGSKHIVQYLLTPQNINIKGRYGRTPVMMAALAGQKSVFQLLVSKKADLMMVDECNGTLLHLACSGGSKCIVHYLLSLVNTNIRDFAGTTPVMHAALTGHTDVFDLLVSKKADLAMISNSGDTLLHAACWGGNKHILQNLLTSSNININSRDAFHRTPIMIAAAKGQIEMFRLLVSKGSTLTVVNKDGNTLLHLACKGGNKLIVQDLLISLDINSRGENGQTPIMVAALNAHQSVFDLLLSKKADLSLVDSQGDNLYQYACKGGNKIIAQRLTCALCKKPGLKSCSRCNSVRYCSKSCQAQHWKKDHKGNCKLVLEKASDGNPVCSWCKSSESCTDLKVCTKCQTVSYCSKSCQIQHWKNGHKASCKPASEKVAVRVTDDEVVCSWCKKKKSSSDLTACSRCNTTLYCSKKCQEEHLKNEHEAVCKSTVEEVSVGVTNDPPVCSWCKERRSLSGLKTCTQCKTTLYCSKLCQKKHWKNGHKQSCKVLAAMPALSDTVIIYSRSLACNWCSKLESSDGLRACRQCNITYYCSKMCQAEHWKAEHKDTCKSRPCCTKQFLH